MSDLLLTGVPSAPGDKVSLRTSRRTSSVVNLTGTLYRSDSFPGSPEKRLTSPLFGVGRTGFDLGYFQTPYGKTRNDIKRRTQGNTCVEETSS